MSEHPSIKTLPNFTKLQTRPKRTRFVEKKTFGKTIGCQLFHLVNYLIHVDNFRNELSKLHQIVQMAPTSVIDEINLIGIDPIKSILYSIITSSLSLSPPSCPQSHRTHPQS